LKNAYVYARARVCARVRVRVCMCARARVRVRVRAYTYTFVQVKVSKYSCQKMNSLQDILYFISKCVKIKYKIFRKLFFDFYMHNK